MTALTIALLMAGSQTPAMKSGDIISRCLAKYANVNSGIGEIVMTQSASGKKISVKTDLQFERPSKMFLHQSSETVLPNDWLVVSDGIQFGYDVPAVRTGERRRLFEPIATIGTGNGEKKLLKLHSIYMAAKRSLGDVPNPFLEFITQGKEENQSLLGYLGRIKPSAEAKEKELLDGSTGYSIGGQIGFGDPTQDGNGVPTGRYESMGRFEMQISKDFDLVSMKTIETISTTDKSNNLPTVINVVTIWSGKMQLNQTPAESIFKVR
jgi:hypothetical protein